MKKMVAGFAALTAVAAVAAGGLLMAGESSAAEDDGQMSLVENFTHPGAEAILAEHGLKVFKGDGNIMLTAAYPFGSGGQCVAGEVQVEKLMDESPFGVAYCFSTIGTTGVLTLEVPGTFGIRGGSKPIQATAELPSGDETYDIAPNAYVPIDPGSTSDVPEAILVELRLTGA